MRDPDRQARFVKALLGLRQDLREYHHDDATPIAIEAVLCTFHEHFPEFMIDEYERDGDSEWGTGVYHADDRMVRQVNEILGQEPISE